MNTSILIPPKTHHYHFLKILTLRFGKASFSFMIVYMIVYKLLDFLLRLEIFPFAKLRKFDPLYVSSFIQMVDYRLITILSSEKFFLPSFMIIYKYLGHIFFSPRKHSLQKASILYFLEVNHFGS